MAQLFELTLSNLTAIRGGRTLFRDLSFQLESGQLLYVRGANGSGKTTLLRTISGLFQSDGGQVLYNNETLHARREACYQDMLFYGHGAGIKRDMTPLENLALHCRLRGLSVSRQDSVSALESAGLAGLEDLPARMLSAGQKRLILLSGLFIEKAPLWILDEPFNALDVSAVERLQAVIAGHITAGGMAVLTTHQKVALTSGQAYTVTLGSAP